VKAGVFTFSLWLPSAHARAMPVVSALLSGLLIKMGVLEIFRLADLLPIGLPLVVMGAVTGIIGILYAVGTYDMKKMLAFHTLSQIGYVLIGFGAGTYIARLGALAYAVAHGLFKALLFLAVGEAAAYVGSARWDALVDGNRDIPWGTRLALLVATLGIVGLPPLAGFDAKAILEEGLAGWTLHIIVIAISVGTALSFAKFVPILAARSVSRTSPNRVMSYVWLGGAIVLFWPLSILMTSASVSLNAIGIPQFVEALAAIAVGTAAYLLLRKRRFRLPEAIFRLEQGPLAILGGFFVVYLLILAGR
jgi:multicomponent Na+:H+ antiporter subunit D